MDPAISLLTVLVLLLTFVLLTLGSQVVRRQGRVKLPLRRIAAYQALPSVTSEAVESERPIHVSFGGSGLGAESTISALAVSDLLYPMAERAAIASRAPLITMSDPTSLGLAQGTLLRAYERRGKRANFHASAARWYPQGPRSLAMAAGVGVALAEEDATLSVAAGRFGPELAFIGEAAIRYDQMFFGHSDQLDGQAVAWVMSDAPLIGEELYMAGAYLPARPSALHLGQVLAQEGLRLLAIVAILLVAVVTLAQEFLMNPALLLGVLAAVLVISGLVVGGIFLLRRVRQRRGAR